MQLSEQELVRRENLQKIRDLGVDPYPAAQFDVNAYAADVKENFVEDDEGKGMNFQEVVMAGRLMSRRVMGKASFAELQDSSGRIQVYVSRDEIAPGEDKALYNSIFKKLLDIGDFIGVKGYAFRTRMGEITIHVTELTVLGKSLRPLPIVKRDEDGNVYDAFTDPELRYRQRYVDLTVNPQYREIFIKRSKIVSAMRRFLMIKAGWR